MIIIGQRSKAPDHAHEIGQLNPNVKFTIHFASGAIYTEFNPPDTLNRIWISSCGTNLSEQEASDPFWPYNLK